MQNSCQKFEPLSLRPYIPHFLEQKRDWNLGTQEIPDLTSPGDYFKVHQDTVLQALQKLEQAREYSPIIEESPGVPEKKRIYLARRIDEVGRAVCRPEAGLKAWGEMVEFLELSTYLSLQKEYNSLPAYYQDIPLWNALSTNADYQIALEEYSGGRASKEECRQFRLDCLSLVEAVQVYNKRLYMAGKENRPPIYLSLAYLHARIFRESKAYSSFERALEYFSGARESKVLELLAVEGMAELYLHKREYRLALQAIDEMGSPPDERCNELKKLALSGLGQHAEADCLSDYARAPYEKEICR